jgi:hypothetical protein
LPAQTAVPTMRPFRGSMIVRSMPTEPVRRILVLL